jgi:hypothetical protein
LSDLNFTNSEALKAHLREKSFILVTHRNCKDYPGMVLVIVIRFDNKKTKYRLDLQWECQGLDFYGDVLQESYLYQFESLEKLMEYLLSKYDIRITDIPVKYKFDPTQFPNVLKDEDKKSQFEVAWKQFQKDFKTGAFLDSSLMLVYDSSDR